ncbi:MULTISPECIES: hypothetical protein [Halolamina]|uniref:Uncharacterized protein n=1 Tax=Halolamina pelagica TaxID=699431 RepID=A0A1I5TE43_9EURY|nr:MULTISPECIES: hypothetical protein [Halolamina]NHX37270.1 hypothetical protein [Halolamina sp. R1-12]SFP80706.1 hypothetical protein SAMN05216277_1098 [Halolamina pelagica]
MSDSTPPVDYPEVLEAIGVIEAIQKREEDEFVEKFNEIAVNPREDLPGTDTETHQRVTTTVGTTCHEISVDGLLDEVLEAVYLRGHSSTNELVRCVVYGVVDQDGFAERLQEKREDDIDYIGHQYQSAGEVLMQEISEALSNLIADDLGVGIFTKNRESWSSGRTSMHHPTFWSFDFSDSTLNSFEDFMSEEDLFWYGIDDIHVSNLNEELMQYGDKERYVFPGRRNFTSSVGSFRFKSILVNFYQEGADSRYSRDGDPTGSMYTRRGYSNLSMIFEKLLWSLYGYYKFHAQEDPEYEELSDNSDGYKDQYGIVKNFQSNRQDIKKNWRRVSRQVDNIKHSFEKSKPFGERSGFIAQLVDNAIEIETYAEEEYEDLIEKYDDAITLVRSDIELSSTIETVDLQNKIKSQNEAAKKLQWIGGILTLVIAVSSAISLLIQSGYL